MDETVFHTITETQLDATVWVNAVHQGHFVLINSADEKHKMLSKNRQMYEKYPKVFRFVELLALIDSWNTGMFHSPSRGNLTVSLSITLQVSSRFRDCASGTLSLSYGPGRSVLPVPWMTWCEAASSASTSPVSIAFCWFALASSTDLYVTDHFAF